MLGWSLQFSTRSCGRRISCVTVRSGVTFIAALFVLAAPTAFAQTALEGRLDAIWGDPHRQSAAPAVRILTLTEDDGEVTELYLSEELLAAAGGFFAWNGKRVRVTLRASGSELPVPDLRPGTRQVAALTLLEGAGAQTEGMGEQTQRAGVSGSHPWVSILCKFNDIGTEPRDLAYFQGMYANAPGGLDDYWREVRQHRRRRQHRRELGRDAREPRFVHPPATCHMASSQSCSTIALPPPTLSSISPTAVPAVIRVSI